MQLLASNTLMNATARNLRCVRPTNGHHNGFAGLAVSSALIAGRACSCPGEFRVLRRGAADNACSHHNVASSRPTWGRPHCSICLVAARAIHQTRSKTSWASRRALQRAARRSSTSRATTASARRPWSYRRPRRGSSTCRSACTQSRAPAQVASRAPGCSTRCARATAARTCPSSSGRLPAPLTPTGASASS